MEITSQCVVALTWTLKDTLGEELDVLDTPVEFLVGGDDLLKRIEEALQGHKVGDTLQLHLSLKTPLATTTTSSSFWKSANCSPQKSKKA